MPQIYISKYNRFVDAVLDRINRLLGKQYDPVRVKLLSQMQKNSPKVKKTPTKVQKKGAVSAPKTNKMVALQKTNKMGELELARSQSDVINNSSFTVKDLETVTKEPEFVLIAKTGSTSEHTPSEKAKTNNQIRAAPVRQNNKRKGAGNSNKKPAANKNKKKNTTNKNGNKTKQSANANKTKQKAKATLFGLSTLKRDGDVTVNMLPEYTTVKTNFVLGPLRLRVEREVARSGKRELRSATATTAEMFGRLNLRLVHGGAATLHSIRVLQPKQVRIDSADDHDKTTEFMWKRSPQIASIVSQKLGAVARSMLKPPPQPRP